MSDLAGLLDTVSVPLYLITAGILILTGDFGGPSIRHTWPVLLIVFGVLRLAAYRSRRTGENHA